MCASSAVVICYNRIIDIKIDTRDLDVLGVNVCMGSVGRRKKVASRLANWSNVLELSYLLGEGQACQGSRGARQ